MAGFDPYQKERQLREDADRWDTSAPVDAEDGDIPVLDLKPFFNGGGNQALLTLAEQLRDACENVGFFSIIGHGIPLQSINNTFDKVREFHALPLDTKREVLMDRPGWPVGGMGYLPVKNLKLPTRAKGNLNEAFLVKCDDTLTMDDNQWPTPEALPGFRKAVEHYATNLEALGKRMLPIFATALDMPANYFEDAFEGASYRLRMTHYPPVDASEQADDEFGIAPHVDTTFMTILAQDSPGLTIFSEKRQRWIKAPLLDNAFVVNTGELLRTWTNDRFISTKHFANNNVSGHSRYSIPFFFNANPHHVMECIPSCCGPDNPAKYPPVSYAGSQAVAQGE